MSHRPSPLPDDHEARKAVPLATGLFDYFPDALVAVAMVSKAGSDQHHPGAPLHWDRSKSADEADALLRHFLERGTLDEQGVPHTARMAWRALALLQKECERARTALANPNGETVALHPGRVFRTPGEAAAYGLGHRDGEACASTTTGGCTTSAA